MLAGALLPVGSASRENDPGEQRVRIQSKDRFAYDVQVLHFNQVEAAGTASSDSFVAHHVFGKHKSQTLLAMNAIIFVR